MDRPERPVNKMTFPLSKKATSAGLDMVGAVDRGPRTVAAQRSGADQTSFLTTLLNGGAQTAAGLPESRQYKPGQSVSNGRSYQRS